jgi:curved DNA-binding protein CbpA
MQYCSCGDLAEGTGNRCARCAALDVLELPANAGESEIKDAYRVLVKVWHPDRFPGDAKLKAAAEEKLKALNAAYVFLTSGAPPRRRPQPAGQTYKAESSKREPPKGEPPRSQAGYYRAAGHTTRRRRWMPSTSMMVMGGALACGVLIAVFVLTSIDSTLASDPATGRIYSGLRYGVIGTMRQTLHSIWSGAGQRLHDLLPQKNAAVAAASPQPVDTAQTDAQNPDHSDSVSQNLHRRELGSAHTAPVRLMPYITTGLSKDEVIAVAGAPASATDDKLVYGSSELYFANGKVVGWKIDPASAPIRVKLWPDAPVDPDLDSFGVGSSKNVVLVVQGTPTYFSANTFGYGRSEVYFQNGRVVSWKEDPGSPLRTAPHYK